MAQTRPALTVDVNVGQGGVRTQHQAARAAAQARASAQAPQQIIQGQEAELEEANMIDLNNGSNNDRGGFSSDEEDPEDVYAGAGSSARANAGSGQHVKGGAHYDEQEVEVRGGRCSLFGKGQSMF